MELWIKCTKRNVIYYEGVCKMPRNKEGKPCGTGGHQKKFTFTYTDISELLDIKEYKVRRLVSEGKLTPTLKGIIEYNEPFEVSNKRNWRNAVRSILKAERERRTVF